LTIELTPAQELIPIPNLYKELKRGSCRLSSMPLNRRHVSAMFNQDRSRLRMSHIS